MMWPGLLELETSQVLLRYVAQQTKPARYFVLHKMKQKRKVYVLQ